MNSELLNELALGEDVETPRPETESPHATPRISQGSLSVTKASWNDFQVSWRYQTYAFSLLMQKILVD